MPPVRSAVRARVAHRVGMPMLALVALLAVAIAWGSAFPLTKLLLDTLSPRQFLSLRFAIAAVALLVAFPRSVLRLPRRALAHAVVLGAVYAAAQLVQTIGLARTPATISGFITGLYVVLTPMCAAVLIRTKVSRRAWAGSALAAVGLGVLALRGLSLGLGEWLTLLGALLYALHIVGLGTWSTARDALGMAVVQTTTIAVLSAAATVPEGFAAPADASGWLILVFLALVAGGGAMIVQTWAQSQMSASRAAVVMATEPVWIAILSIAFFGEQLTWRILAGGAVMLTAMLVVESRPRARSDPAGTEDLPKLS